MRMEMEEKEGSNEESREVKEIRRSKKWDEKKKKAEVPSVFLQIQTMIKSHNRFHPVWRR